MKAPPSNPKKNQQLDEIFRCLPRAGRAPKRPLVVMPALHKWIEQQVVSTLLRMLSRKSQRLNHGKVQLPRADCKAARPRLAGLFLQRPVPGSELVREVPQARAPGLEVMNAKSRLCHSKVNTSCNKLWKARSWLHRSRF